MTALAPGSPRKTGSQGVQANDPLPRTQRAPPRPARMGSLGCFQGIPSMFALNEACLADRLPSMMPWVGLWLMSVFKTHLQMRKLRPGAWEASAGLGPFSCSCLVLPHHHLSTGKAETLVCRSDAGRITAPGLAATTQGKGFQERVVMARIESEHECGHEGELSQ